ncbi:molybdate ABC transporter substrate-binding protein [Schaalia sp. JY-X169]|uniref:molybdate ABC transporter substrate-binding protein n=1 Tax=Schaalia sp. JY-X169 TaxID=2758572 RepID=UPI0015F65AF8|nr:molybdate ABC transporter substrate-binding protein [Schaalia sp. JY-X169]
MERSILSKVVLGLGITSLLLGGCAAGGGTSAESGAAGTSTQSATSGDTSSSEARTLTVFAAASMEPTFTELAKMFEGVKVVFNFAGSQDLQEQIVEGAPADVFASANEKQMAPVVEAGLNSSEPIIYATNQLTIVTPPDNPAQIATFQDLTKEGLLLVICAPEVPCGAATQKVVEASGVTLKPVSEEQSVTDVLAKVQAGEADAGLVYKTDAISAGDTVEAIAFPESADAVNKNPIVAVTTGAEPELGQEWVDFILSDSVQQILKDAGFGPAQTS